MATEPHDANAMSRQFRTAANTNLDYLRDRMRTLEKARDDLEAEIADVNASIYAQERQLALLPTDRARFSERAPAGVEKSETEERSQLSNADVSDLGAAAVEDALTEPK